MNQRKLKAYYRNNEKKIATYFVIAYTIFFILLVYCYPQGLNSIWTTYKNSF